MHFFSSQTVSPTNRSLFLLSQLMWGRGRGRSQTLVHFQYRQRTPLSFSPSPQPSSIQNTARATSVSEGLTYCWRKAILRKQQGLAQQVTLSALDQRSPAQLSDVSSSSQLQCRTAQGALRSPINVKQPVGLQI